ncbi:MAG: hypothetical protein LQ346_008638 [Caloplaca aetnensis]|nr:MAG: hypothetical protein LQ346_008638 [Caloplaca aetnensis]
MPRKAVNPKPPTTTKEYPLRNRDPVSEGPAAATAPSYNYGSHPAGAPPANRPIVAIPIRTTPPQDPIHNHLPNNHNQSPTSTSHLNATPSIIHDTNWGPLDQTKLPPWIRTISSNAHPSAIAMVVLVVIVVVLAVALVGSWGSSGYWEGQYNKTCAMLENRGQVLMRRSQDVRAQKGRKEGNLRPDEHNPLLLSAQV